MASKTTDKDEDVTARATALSQERPAKVDKPPLPKADEEFEFKDIESAPAWVDRGWASYSNGPALALPVDLFRDQPYTTITARVGDKVQYVAASGSRPAHFEVSERDASLDEGVGTAKPAQASSASLEDLIKLGHVAPADLGADAKAQVAARSPALADIVNGEAEAPKAQPVAVTATSA